MLKKENNYAFIDSQNLNLAIRSLGWKLDFLHFRVYLREKYGVAKAYMLHEYQKAIIVSGDGDFHCLVKHLLEKEKLKAIIIPNRFKFSALLKFKMFRPYLRFLNELKDRLSHKKEKAP